MIAASEPLEFVPHGRTVLEKHPGKIYSKGRSSSIPEHSLLYKLTNFGIKDESLLETRDVEEREWWCVREVYSCKSEDFEDDQAPTTKETKDEYISESFRPQSRLKNDFNISIKSELMAGGKKMEMDYVSAPTGSSRIGSANSSSNMSKKFNLGLGADCQNRNKPLNPKTDCCFEEELYVKGCTAVWSKGLISTPATRLSSPETREIISCYTLENPIKHAVFCNFHVSINNTMLIDALNSQIGDAKKNIKIEDTTEHLQTKNMPSILLIDNKNARVYAKDGREYVTSIPFQVKKVWPMKYGVLLEKDATPMIHNSLLPLSFLKLNESNNSTFSKSRSQLLSNMSAKLRQESMSTYDHDVPLPTCFSMSHPLDEVTPLLMKSPSHGLQYYNDGDLQIIFVSTTPSIILLCDRKLGTHSLWRIRKALREECLTMCPNINSTSTVFSQSCDFAASPMNSHVRNATSVGSPHQSKKGVGTPTGSKINSPLAAVFHQQGLSPHTSIGQAFSSSMMVNTIHQAPPTLPLYPDICLDHIWTDTQNIRRDPVESPNDLKSFLHTDLVGHNYLCFMTKVGGVSKLQIMRLQKSHSLGQSSKTNIIVGSISSVMAKDAVVLEHLQMMALIDEAGNIILQSGNSVVGKVHVGGVLARLIDSPYTKRSTFQSPFPRRSSLLPSSSKDASVFGDPALHLLSPVPHSSARIVEQKESFGLQSLCDTAGNRLTLCFDKGMMYRITLPDIACSSLVDKCCAALKAILPKDVTMQVIIKWYGTRNAPGTQDLTPEQEWSMFANLLYSLVGYDLERLSLPKKTDDMGESSEVVTKKQRTSSDGTQDDWDYLLDSKLHKTYGNCLANMLNLSQTKSETKSHRPTLGRKKSQTEEKSNQFNSNSMLFPYTAQVLYAFHLVYEDTKLNTLLLNELDPLSHFLCQLAKDMKLEKYVTHYWLDFPTEHSLEFDDSDSQMSESHLKKLIQPTYFCMEPPSFFSYLNCMLKDMDAGYYPYLSEVNNMSRDLIEVLTTIGCGRSAGIQTISSRDTMTASSTPRTRRDHQLHLDPNTRAVLLLAERGITLRDVDNLPPAVSLLLLNILSACRSNPPQGCCELVMRPELATMGDDQAQDALGLEVQEKETAYTLCRVPDIECVQNKSDDKDSETKTGMEHLETKLLRLLYPRDHRMSEVLSLLQSSTPVTINLTQRADVSDHDFIEEQEKYLYAVSGRTMATPVARGMLTLRTLPCVPTEPLTLPKLCVSGRGPPPRCNTIELSQDSPGCLAWPQFHNGCAAGLAAVPTPGYALHAAQEKYNKPKGSQELSNEHAGFLMALGLNGHLKEMPFMNIYEYLVKEQEMISIGLLLGLAATYRGSMDIQATKTMSIHLEPLLPPTSIELDTHQNVLVAALLGIGLIYQQTQHTHYAHVLLDEIGKPNGPDTENCWSREGYALAAGLALGLVCVASDVPQAITTQLRLYMLGGSAKEKPKQGTFAPRESSAVNLDVTSPGATLALGLIYLGSGNQAVASWLEPPQTSYLLDAVRPDFLMLRCIARGLILWHEVEPDIEWVESQVPATIQPYCFVKPTEDNIDYEAMHQAYCNIVAGACFTLGLRFAGSGNEDARDTLLHYTNLFLTLAGKSLGELAGKSTLESCLCVCLLAAGMVMSGRGDIPVLRVCRRLRARVPTAPVSSRTPALSHGPQMAVHCTIGLLFLGGGRCSLSTDPASIAALLAAFFPKFPTHSEDNRYHLQAFRHLYVLAVEPRLILPRDLSTGRLCYAHIQVVDLQGSVQEMKAPCILPQLDTLREVRVSEPRYWPVVYRRDTNWDQLEKFLKHTWCIDIKPRAGCLSYLDDPQGFHTILAQTLTLDKANIWSATPDNIELFTSDEKVRSFTQHYLATLQNIKEKLEANICADCLLLEKKKGKKGAKSDTLVSKQCYCRKHSKEEMEFVQGLSMVTYECVLKDILCALPVWATFLKILKSLKTEPSSYQIWQIKLLLSHSENHYRRTLNEMKIDDEETIQNELLISNEFTIAIGQKVGNIFDSVETKIQPYLRKYLGLPSCRKIGNSEDQLKKILSAFLVYHDIPKGVLRGLNCDNSLSVMLELENSNLSANTVGKIESLL